MNLVVARIENHNKQTVSRLVCVIYTYITHILERVVQVSGTGVRQSQARLKRPGGATRQGWSMTRGPGKCQLDSSGVSRDRVVR